MRVQFLHFTIKDDIDLGDKSDIAIRLRQLMNRELDLHDYSDTAKSLLFSPIISDAFIPKLSYGYKTKQINIDFHIPVEVALQLTAPDFFDFLKSNIISGLRALNKPKDFQIDQFAKDLDALQFDQLTAVEPMMMDLIE